MVLPFLIHIPILIFLAIWLRKRYRESPLSKFYWWALGWKVFAGISVGLIYIYYYNSVGDTTGFQHYSNLLIKIFKDDPEEFLRIFFFDKFSEKSQIAFDIHPELRVIYFLKILTLLNLLTFSNYWISGLYLSLFSFAGAWMLSNTLVRVFKTPVLGTAFAFLFFPSFIFWTSGILKETLVMGAICFIVAYFLQYLHLKRQLRILEVLLILILLYYSWNIKFYYILILLPTLISYALVVFLSKKIPAIQKPIFTVASFLLIFCFLGLSAITLHPSLSIDYLCLTLYENYLAMISLSNVYGVFTYKFENLSPDFFQILSSTPKALFIGLFRPFIWETSLNISVLAGVENLFILILSLGKIFQAVKSPQKLRAETVAVLTYIFLTAAIMALIGPNWGTLVRYKCAFIPFWVLFLTSNNPLFDPIEKRWSEWNTKVLS